MILFEQFIVSQIVTLQYSTEVYGDVRVEFRRGNFLSNDSVIIQVWKGPFPIVLLHSQRN